MELKAIEERMKDKTYLYARTKYVMQQRTEGEESRTWPTEKIKNLHEAKEEASTRRSIF